MMRERQTYCIHRARVQRALARNAPNSIRAKELLHMLQGYGSTANTHKPRTWYRYSFVFTTCASTLPFASRARMASPGFTITESRSSVPSGPYTKAYPRLSTAKGDRAFSRADACSSRVVRVEMALTASRAIHC